MPSIVPINLVGPGVNPAAKLSPAKPVDAFASVLQDAMHKVNEFQQNAGQSVESFLSGETTDLHQTIMAGQKAELAFELFSQVRNKVVQAYQEVMRMQV
ncbi:MAG: flagellar hook-basal body complex protein FliE [Bryobacteraceae bacterium]